MCCSFWEKCKESKNWPGVQYPLNRNKLTLNIKKTKLMLFGTTKNLDKFKNVSLKYNNNAIERVDNFRYLGVIFDSHMT